MKKLITLLFSLLLLHSSAYSQRAKSYQPLSGYDFHQGGYALLFVGAYEDTAFFINSVQSLNLLQKAWVLDEEAVTYPFACNDGFRVLLLHDDVAVDQFSIRLRCQAFVAAGEWWHFPGNPSRDPDAKTSDQPYREMGQSPDLQAPF